MADKKNILKTYTWNGPSVLSRIDVREQDNNEAVAYLHAAEGDKHLPDLRELRVMFKEKGWVVSSDSHRDQPVLRLTGLHNAQELITGIEELQKEKQKSYVSGEMCMMEEKPKEEKPKGFVETVKMHSSRLSGIVYTIGNSLYIASGLARGKDWGQMGTGIAFSTGDVLLAVAGGKDDNAQFKLLLKKLTKEWKKNGIELSENSAIGAEIAPKPRTFGEKVYDFTHEHINKFKAGAEVMGAVMYFKAGMDQHALGQPQGRWKQACSIIFGLGFGSTLFIEEKKPDPEKLKNAGMLEKAWAWVQEKPLRMGGYSGLSNTMFTTIGALKERAQDPSKHLYKYDLAAAGTMFIGNNLYALSSKSAGGNITNTELIKDVYGLAAEVLNKQPEAQREDAFRKTVEFLGARTEIADTRAEAEVKLRAEMERMRQENPWFKQEASPLAPATPAQEAPAKWSQREKMPIPSQKWEETVARNTDSATPSLAP